ncbi:MAG TPA: glycosyltransferase family 2 protein [Desulfatiglandales bacterium]|nr:glycosyltransferase family 2 protein [Desulfatiglandales bacterium]
MKLIIQIPCFNEEKTLPITLSALPRNVPGVDSVEWLIIDDGSTDHTVEVAKEYGVDHVVALPRNQGLAKAFMAGLEASLKAGADIIVNTDADNQYCADCIPDLIRPILEAKAEMVVGARPIEEIEHFSFIKKLLQRLGSWAVRLASNTDIPDAPSGFRAISREAARKLNVFNGYTYTLETIIQAGQKNIPVTWVPIRTNEYLRQSRLVKNLASYVRRSILTILRIFVVYNPFRFFVSIGALLFTLGTLIGIRFLWYFLNGQGGGHVQSLILASILIGIGFQTIMVAFIADLLSVNRRLLEELQYKSRDGRKNKD